MEMLPLFRSMKVYTKDILYHQEDQSEELFFIVTGEVKFYVKLNIEGQKPKNVPIHKYVAGSYFGDSDVLLNQGRDGRESTARAMMDCMLQVITREKLLYILKKFPIIKQEMRSIAGQRKTNYKKNVKLAYA